MVRLWFLSVAVILGCAALAPRAPSARPAFIPGGAFTPQYGPGGAKGAVRVAPFRLDRTPVTNADFEVFVRARSEWAPKQAPRVFADSNYLRHWVGGSPASVDSNRPVVNISWFAASAYCKFSGGFLPSTLQWEFSAAASDAKPDATSDPEFVQQLLTWYSTPSGPSPGETPTGAPNYWGIFNMHGLVWEWTEDFNSVFVAGDNRRDGESLKNVFCGSGGESAADKANYAAFMRYALRSSLRGEFTTPNLGFRCAYSASKEK